MAQAPQFAGSVCSSTHEPEHVLWFSGQLEPAVPPLALPAAPASFTLPPWLMPAAPACAALEPACALPAVPAFPAPPVAEEPALAPALPALPALAIGSPPALDESDEAAELEQPASASQTHAMPETRGRCTLRT